MIRYMRTYARRAIGQGNRDGIRWNALAMAKGSCDVIMQVDDITPVFVLSLAWYTHQPATAWHASVCLYVQPLSLFWSSYFLCTTNHKHQCHVPRIALRTSRCGCFHRKKIIICAVQVSGNDSEILTHSTPGLCATHANLWFMFRKRHLLQRHQIR